MIAGLRAVCPHRPLNMGESIRVAELQAARLLLSSEVTKPPVGDAVIADLPRIEVSRIGRIPVSGSVHWSKGRWVIALNRGEAYVRQRFSLAHEFKHVLDAPFGTTLYPAWRGLSSENRAEQAADHFAACVLMPKAWVKRAYYDDGITDLGRLAYRFNVSQAAMRVRLGSLGIVNSRSRCGLAEAA